ncbi:MAG: TerC family protein [Candidatus Nanopelagicales bacterium]
MPSVAAAVRAAESTGEPTLSIPLSVWGLTLAIIAALFTLDLIVGARNPHVAGFRESLRWSVFYIGVAIAFGLVFGWWAGSPYGAEYFAGYIVEKTLSVDNLFVFVIIMGSFAVPVEHRRSLLTMGIALALVLRAIFIALGATLLHYFSFMFLLFGVILIYTGIKLYQHRDQDPDVTDNAMVRAVKRAIPVTPDYHGGHLFVREGGHRMATPLFIAFVAIASTDILFALDSIPAVYGVTDEPYIVFVANAFALLGLRALFFLVDGLLDRLVYLSTGLALILVFIGFKLALHWAHGVWAGVPEISIGFSLAVIVGVLTITTITSLVAVRRNPELRAHAGSFTDNVEPEAPGPGPGQVTPDQ